MDRIQELLGNITSLSDDELKELADLVTAEINGGAAEDEVPADEIPAADAPAPKVPAGAGAPFASLPIEKLTELANAAEAYKTEVSRRRSEASAREAAAAKLADFQNVKIELKDEKPVEEAPAAPGPDPAPVPTEVPAAEEPAAAPAAPTNEVPVIADAPTAEVPVAEVPVTAEAPVSQEVPVEVPPATEAEDEQKEEALVADAGEVTPEVPEDRKPQRRRGGYTAITAGADLPGFALGAEFKNMDEVASAFARRLDSMRGIRGADGDKMIVASAALQGMEDRRLSMNDAEGNLRRVMDVIGPKAIVAAGGLGAPEEVRYDLFDAGGDTNRPIRDMLPVFTADRGGVRFMRPPTLNDVNGVVGIWTVQNDIDAVTNPAIRKPSFRVAPGPEIVVDIQAITMIMTFGNLMTRAYPELIKRHTELAEVAHARVAEQQLLTQIGALSTSISGRTQRLGAAREVMSHLSLAAASYRNRHRINGAIPLRAIFPAWFRDLLRADISMQHPGDGLESLTVPDSLIDNFFTSRNIRVTWAMDGEAGQDFSAISSGGYLTDYPAAVRYYLFTEGTFAFMDGGTLDLGLVRDSTLNAANDYQMFVETFENVVKFGTESLRVTHALRPTGQGSADVKDVPADVLDPAV